MCTGTKICTRNGESVGIAGNGFTITYNPKSSKRAGGGSSSVGKQVASNDPAESSDPQATVDPDMEEFANGTPAQQQYRQQNGAGSKAAATGEAITEALAPTPGGQVKLAKKGAEAAAKGFSKEKQALVDMAKADKKAGASRSDMKAYEDLNKGLPVSFPANKVRLDEGHLGGASHSQVPHGHVGPVDHIPISDP